MTHLPYLGFNRKNTINLVLSNDLQELEVFINVTVLGNHDSEINYWFEDIELFINYGTYLELSRGKYYYQRHLSRVPFLCLTHIFFLLMENNFQIAFIVLF